MKMVKFAAVAALTLGLLAGFVLRGVANVKKDDKKEPKYTIKEVMKEAHAGKDALLKKINANKAEKADKEKLVELYTALSENKPPKGDEADWKEKTKALVTAAKDYAADKEGAVAELKKATNCMACHKAHK